MSWSYGALVGRRLLAWSAASVIAGVLLLALGDPWWQGFGLQAVVWGAIDGAIGLIGIVSAGRSRRRAADDPAADAREARKLRRLLLLNAGLDVLYIAGGLIVAGPVAAGDPFVAGNGWGIVLQGAFLLLFDLLHGLRVPVPSQDAGAS